MGQDGRSYRQILDFYYPGAKLGVSAQGLRLAVRWAESASKCFTTQPGEGPVPGRSIADRLARGS